jgi:hypothetical protein
MEKSSGLQADCNVACHVSKRDRFRDGSKFDFSHLSAEGVGYARRHDPQKRGVLAHQETARFSNAGRRAACYETRGIRLPAGRVGGAEVIGDRGRGGLLCGSWADADRLKVPRASMEPLSMRLATRRNG